MNWIRIARGWLAGAALAVVASAAGAQQVVESPRSLPVLHEVDIVVVGGTSAGVAAAVEAARQGAKVFLAAPRPYLGEDICATYRLWLEPGESATTELARQVYALPTEPPPAGPGLSFTYSANATPDARHRDTTPPGKLADGRFHGAPDQSVQYNTNVTLVLDLGSSRTIQQVDVMAYQRPGDFEVERVQLSAGDNRNDWKAIGALTNAHLGSGTFEGTALPLTIPVEAHARYLRLEVCKSPQAGRLLLGEVIVHGKVPEAAPAAAATAEPGPRAVKPMQVKRVLDAALLQAGVPFLYNCPATEVLTDAHGYPAGVAVANRSGRQAILARVIIDATEHATVTRLTRTAFRPPADAATFSRVVVGGEPQQRDGLNVRQRPAPFVIRDRAEVPHAVIEYELRLPLPEDTPAAWANAEQLARDWTWTPQTVDASEVLFQVPRQSIRAKETLAGPWPGPDRIALDVFRPAELDQVFVAGPCADVSRDVAATIARPVNAMAIGTRIGAKAAEVAKTLPRPEAVRLAGATVPRPVSGDVGEVPAAVNPRAGTRSIPAEPHPAPVLGSYDVVVVGGGTGGAPAGIGAGRQGARTLLIEHLHGLGGVGTLGLISSYYHGNRVGFTKEVDDGVLALSGPNPRVSSAGWNPEHKSEWYRRALRQAGVDVWYGTLGAGAVVENGRVKGVVVVTPQGRGVVLAGAVVDATGNADVAAAAGAPCRYIDESDVAVQGTGLPPRELGARYTNTDYTFVDDTDIYDTWRVLVTAKEKFKGAYDLGQLVDTRERRQILGDFTLSPMDMMLRRTFPDTVVISRSNFDSHGFIVHPMFMLRPPDRADVDVRVPYRCLLPRGLDRLLVTGLGVSAHRDALPVIRMQADVQNQGYAAGVAAAMMVRQGVTSRQLDLKALQRHLVEKGNLPAEVLTEQDSFPLPTAQVARAVRDLTNEYAGLELVLAQFDTAQPLLRKAYADAADPNAKLVYAHVLGMLHDGTGTATLLEAVRAATWDKGWRYTGMGQFGPCMSPLDSWIIALGRTGARQALPPLLEKLRQLEAASEFSHFRAVAMALESLADPAAAPVLAEVLRKPGVGGHASTDSPESLKTLPSSATDTSLRNRALSELLLARALYRCGDVDGLGAATLRRYAADLHGHYARHAQAVLASAPGAAK